MQWRYRFKKWIQNRLRTLWKFRWSSRNMGLGEVWCRCFLYGFNLCPTWFNWTVTLGSRIVSHTVRSPGTICNVIHNPWLRPGPNHPRCSLRYPLSRGERNGVKGVSPLAHSDVYPTDLPVRRLARDTKDFSIRSDFVLVNVYKGNVEIFYGAELETHRKHVFVCLYSFYCFFFKGWFDPFLRVWQ